MISAILQCPDVGDRVFTRSGKRRANFQQMCSKYTWIAGSLLDVCWIV